MLGVDVKNLKNATVDLAIFGASRVIDALSLVVFVWLGVVIAGGSAAYTSEPSGFYDAYLLVRGYFYVLGYAFFSALAFVVTEILGGFRTRKRLLVNNVGIMLLHGVALGVVLSAKTAFYWSIGLCMLSCSAFLTYAVWWPWIERRRER